MDFPLRTNSISGDLLSLTFLPAKTDRRLLRDALLLPAASRLRRPRRKQQRRARTMISSAPPSAAFPLSATATTASTILSAANTAMWALASSATASPSIRIPRAHGGSLGTRSSSSFARRLAGSLRFDFDTYRDSRPGLPAALSAPEEDFLAERRLSGVRSPRPRRQRRRLQRTTTRPGSSNRNSFAASTSSWPRDIIRLPEGVVSSRTCFSPNARREATTSASIAGRT